MTFNAYQIIYKKRKMNELSLQEIEWFIQNYTSGNIPDYQMSAFLMCWAIHGATADETFALTKAMLDSGKTIHFEGAKFVDKHSTGGIGDKTSFILAPIAAAAGVHVPMVAGRGLGFTGGTVDKVEAIKNFSTSLTLEQFANEVKENKLALIAQTSDIAPADGKIYALRDVTATIDSIPLITASIMSKKLAEGANGIVMDIKWGSGAFMRTVEDASLLAESLKTIALKFNKKFTAYITNMNDPLGSTAGHSLELIECVEILKGKIKSDLSDLSIRLAAEMILMAQICPDFESAHKMAQEQIDNGKALIEFEKLIQRQGGDTSFINDYSLLPACSLRTDLKANQNGFLQINECANLGHLLIELGAGRKQKIDKIDFAPGLIFYKKTGDQVKEGDVIMTIVHHASQQEIVDSLIASSQKNIFLISHQEISAHKLIEKII